MDDSTFPTPRFKGAQPPARDAAREARRAEALRINLRRRKVAASPTNAPPPTSDS